MPQCPLGGPASAWDHDKPDSPQHTGGENPVPSAAVDVAIGDTAVSSPTAPTSSSAAFARAIWTDLAIRSAAAR